MPCARKSKLPELARPRSSNTSMNVAPMILRFCSGSVTPASRSRKSRTASTNTSGSCSRSKRRRICSASSSRSTPLSTKMHVSRSPMARWMSSAATVESTPPLSRRRRGPSPTCARMRAVASSTNDAIVQSPRAAADVVGEVAQDVEAALGVRDLGVEQQRVEPPRRRPPSPRPARWRSSPTTAKPGGRRRDEVAVAGPDAQLVAARSRTAARRARCRPSRWPNSRCGAGPTRPPEHVGHQLHAVADAEHRHARARSTAAVAARRARPRDTLFGPPDRMMPTGRRRGNLCRRRVERQNLGVDGQLAQPARDELRVLRAEVEDDDGLMRHVLVIVGANRTPGRCVTDRMTGMPRSRRSRAPISNAIIECGSRPHHIDRAVSPRCDDRGRRPGDQARRTGAGVSDVADLDDRGVGRTGRAAGVLRRPPLPGAAVGRLRPPARYARGSLADGRSWPAARWRRPTSA